MATPIGHALAGLAVASFTHRADDAQAQARPQTGSMGALFGQFFYKRGPITVLAVLMALAPDLDLIPGMMQGQPVLYHGGISHSLGSGILLSLLAAWLWPRNGWQWRNGRIGQQETALAIFMISFLAFSTHLLLDMMGPDGRAPFGIPLLWPLTDMRFLSPTPILMGVQHTSYTTAGFSEFLGGIFSMHNIIAIAWECVCTVPFILLGEWHNRQRLSQSRMNAYH